MKKLLFTIAALALPVATVPAQTTIDFENSAPCSDCLIPNGYSGLNWTNFGGLNTSTYGPVSGYQPGTTSGEWVGFSWLGEPASVLQGSSPFTLNSGQFTAAWFDDMTLSITGFTPGGIPTYFASYILSATGPTLLTFDWANLESVSFVTTGGTPHPGYNDFCCNQFALDDLIINTNAVPEPGSMVLLGTGFVCLFGMARRRRNKTGDASLA